MGHGWRTSAEVRLEELSRLIENRVQGRAGLRLLAGGSSGDRALRLAAAMERVTASLERTRQERARLLAALLVVHQDDEFAEREEPLHASCA